jgi:D-threo-aldose 1-dehydrogenase
MTTDQLPSAEMPRVTLGRTGIETSSLSLGTWGFGNVGNQAARVGDDDADLAALLTAAFVAGVRFLDSADAYDNEDRLGRVLAQIEVPEDLIIGTKFGHGRGFDADGIRRSAEQSLKNLNLERLPLLMVHDPRDEDDMKAVLGAGGALEGLRRLQDEGLVGAIGVATGTFRPLEMSVDCGEFDCVQFPRLYTLLNQASKDRGLLGRAKEAGLGTLNPAPFGGNILATGAVEGALYCYRPALPDVVAAVERMEAECRRLGVPLITAALAFSLSEPLIDVTIVGVASADQLHDNLRAFAAGVSREDLETIAAAGKVDPHILGGPDFRKAWPLDRQF